MDKIIAAISAVAIGAAKAGLAAYDAFTAAGNWVGRNPRTALVVFAVVSIVLAGFAVRV